MNDINKFIKQIKKVLNEVGGEAYLVGGFVRDKLINFKSEPKNVDIVYDGDINKLLLILDIHGYKFSLIERNKETYRCNCENITFDITKMEGRNIQDDLSKRDFTINSICMKLSENKIIDPFKGRRAIECRIIQHVNEKGIEEDPIRILRGIRLCVKYGMHFNLKTEQKIIEAAPQLKNCNKERVFNEFMKLIEIDNEGKAFYFLDDYNVLRNILPYVDELKTIGKCKYHIEDVFTHMNLSYGVFKDIIKGKIIIKGFDLSFAEEYIGSFKLKEYISVACFLHDIGKFNCFKQDSRVSFIGHEKEGAKIVKDLCESMKFPEKAAELMEKIVEAHMCPLGIFKDDTKEKRKAFYKSYEEYKEYIPFILIVSFCDNYATHMLLDEISEQQTYKQFIEDMLIENQTISSKKY